ncbi:hypothetical protein [Clostridium tarantellae]|uniref:Uncharacterized protein n=1 Tax=Clostridium tarantellae TaxID=39493 RepID=A0A6I1MVX9_9CLOT|nr:hypothetical protein [Clostridium tarantellae]MPQ44981.1 hypothetical protein [Clostridium tarantellae]
MLKTLLNNRFFNFLKNKNVNSYEGEIFCLLAIGKLVTFLLLLYLATNLKPINTINPLVVLIESTLLIGIFFRIFLLHKKQLHM